MTSRPHISLKEALTEWVVGVTMLRCLNPEDLPEDRQYEPRTWSMVVPATDQDAARAVGVEFAAIVEVSTDDQWLLTDQGYVTATRQPVVAYPLPESTGLIDVHKDPVTGIEEWTLTCSACGELGRYPMVPIVGRSEPEKAWDNHDCPGYVKQP